MIRWEGWAAITDVTSHLIFVPEETFFLSSFLFWSLLTTHCKYRGLWLHRVTLRHTTHGRTPLDKWSARRTDLYLTTHTTHKRQTPMSPGGIRNHKPSKQAATIPRLRPHGHRNRSKETYLLKVRSSSGTVSTFSETLYTQFWYLMCCNRLQSWSGVFRFPCWYFTICSPGGFYQLFLTSYKRVATCFFPQNNWTYWNNIE